MIYHFKMQRCTKFVRVVDRHEPITDAVTLPYADRYRRRARLTTDAGEAILLDLPEATELRDGAARRQLGLRPDPSGGSQRSLCGSVDKLKTPGASPAFS